MRAPWPHRRQPVHAGAAQGAQQEGLGLVVAMVGKREDLVVAERVRERAMARVTRGAFHPEPRRAINLGMDDRQRHAQHVAGALAMRGPVIGIGMQPVVHVDGTQAGASRATTRSTCSASSREPSATTKV